MITLIRTLAVAASGTVLAAIDVTGNARALRRAPTYAAIGSESAPKLVVAAPQPKALARGVYRARYRVENLRTALAFGVPTGPVSPRVHLHVVVDGLPWRWEAAGDNNAVDITDLPRGEHKVTIQLAGPDHSVFPGQVVTHAFTVPNGTVATAPSKGSPARPASRD